MAELRIEAIMAKLEATHKLTNSQLLNDEAEQVFRVIEKDALLLAIYASE